MLAESVLLRYLDGRAIRTKLPASSWQNLGNEHMTVYQ